MLLGTQRINDGGHLEIGGCDTVALAREFGTPLYVVDEQTIRENCRRYREAFHNYYPNSVIAYAGKAFLNKAMCAIIDAEGLHLDVASQGELFTALEAGFPPSRIEHHGNNKSRAELQMSIRQGVGRIIVDNFLELEMLADLAQQADAPVPVLIRSTPGIDPQTHRLIRTGQADTKFGFGINDGSALEAVRKALTIPNIKLLGIHCHIGSQLLEADSHVEAINIVVPFLASIKQETGFEAEELNIGGGLGIRYLPQHQPPSIETFAEAICAALNLALSEAGLQPPRLVLEPGRSIVGEAGTTLYTVGAIKTVRTDEAPGTRTYVAIDGGMSDNPRPQLYDAVYNVILANKANQPATLPARIAGSHCETDILIQEAEIAQPETGDILAVQSTGAYNYAMASNYNRFTRPAVVLVNNGDADIIVRRETLEDLTRCDIVPSRLAPFAAAKP